MVASLIVGALQNRKSNAPTAVLSELNAVLAGRIDGGFTTCCCALFGRENRVSVANAGHPAPYRNGEEITTPPGLPLGIDGNAEWIQVDLQLQPGDRLVFVSDGVVEARNVKGELLGFEGARQLTTQSAAEIARAAQAFGQEDDITVLSITSLEPRLSAAAM